MTHRRHFLRHLGLGALAGLPLASALNPSAAQGTRPPLRVVFFYDKPSFIERYSRPRRPDGRPWPTSAADAQTIPGERRGEWAFGEGWSPLEGLEDECIMLSGLDFPTRPNADGSGQRRLNHAPHSDGGGHGYNMAMALTSHEIQPDDRAGGASIDQFIADGLAAAGDFTPLHSVVAGINGEGGSSRGTGSFRADGSIVPAIADPVELYDRLFPPHLREQDEAASQARLERAARADILVRSLAAEATRRLPREQGLRVEAHMQLHADARARAQAGLYGAAIPDRTSLAGWDAGIARDDPFRFDRGATDLNMTSIAAALHARITRVALLRHGWPAPEEWDFVEGQIGDSSRGRPAQQGSFGTLDDHSFHHEIARGHGLEFDARANELGIKLQHVYARRLRGFIEMLSALPDGDGTSVMDNTLIVACSEMPNVSHGATNGHWILIGNAHGHFRTGRSLLLPRTGPTWRRYAESGEGAVLNGDIFAAVSEAMGVDPQGYGHPSLRLSPLSALS